MTSRRRQTAARMRNKNQKQSGLSNMDKPGFLLVGVLRRPHGVKGEILMGVLTDFPERLKPGAEFYLGSDHQQVEFKQVRHHNKGLIVFLEGYPTREDVENLRNIEVFVRADDRPKLPKGEYYLHELVGLQVITDQGVVLGVMTGSIETGANDVYVVQSDEGKEILLPAIDEVILKVDAKDSKITVHLLDGLLPD
jgi:16S rRNA processing protein RimM